jgi:hypothetical protein
VWPAGSVRGAGLDGCPGALECAVHCGDGRVERLGGFFGGEAEYVTEDERPTLRCRQVLQGGDECELHGLALLVACLGAREALWQADLLVRVGLDPYRHCSGLTRPLVGAGWCAVLDRQLPLRSSRECVEADVGGDPVQPWSEPPLAAEPG